MNWVAIFTIFILNLHQSIGSVSEYNFAQPKGCKVDVSLYGNVIEEMEVVAEALCAQGCARNDQCQSYNYEEKTTRLCELSSAVPDAMGSNVDHQDGMAYFMKEEEMKNAIEEPCGQFTACRHLASIGSQDVLANRHNTQGYIGKDPLSDDDKVYFYTSYNDVRTLYEHPTEQDYRSDTNRIQYNLPVGCDGSQATVYGGLFYCAENDQRKVLIYNLADTTDVYARISLEDVEGHRSGYVDECSYNWGGYSSIDIDVDELGLWIIWGRQPEGCNFALSKINTQTFAIEQNWYIPLAKTSRGNAFMQCGTLYVLDHAHNNPSYFRWTYNTRDDTLTEFSFGNAMLFYNSNGYTASLHYNPKEKMLYSWDNAYQKKWPLTFNDDV